MGRLDWYDLKTEDLQALRACVEMEFYQELLQEKEAAEVRSKKMDANGKLVRDAPRAHDVFICEPKLERRNIRLAV